MQNKNIGPWNKKGTRLAQRNKLNLNMKQKYRNHGTKKGTRLAEGTNQIYTQNKVIGTVEQKKEQG
jgi:hypothetical protein